MDVYLRSKNNGVIFPYNDRLLAAGGLEVVTEKEAFPERFAPAKLSEREQSIKLTVDEAAFVPEPSPELVAEATSRLKPPRMVSKRKVLIADSKG